MRLGVSELGNMLTITQALNPGNLWTDLDRNSTGLFLMFRKMTTFPPIYGAYTELFASLSPDITIENSGSWSECIRTNPLLACS